MQQHREARCPLNQRSDRRAIQSKDEITFPVAWHCAIFNAGRRSLSMMAGVTNDFARALLIDIAMQLKGSDNGRFLPHEKDWTDSGGTDYKADWRTKEHGAVAAFHFVYGALAAKSPPQARIHAEVTQVPARAVRPCTKLGCGALGCDDGSGRRSDHPREPSPAPTTPGRVRSSR